MCRLMPLPQALAGGGAGEGGEGPVTLTGASGEGSCESLGGSGGLFVEHLLSPQDGSPPRAPSWPLWALDLPPGVVGLVLRTHVRSVGFWRTSMCEK